MKRWNTWLVLAVVEKHIHIERHASARIQSVVARIINDAQCYVELNRVSACVTAVCQDRQYTKVDRHCAAPVGRSNRKAVSLSVRADAGANAQNECAEI